MFNRVTIPIQFVFTAKEDKRWRTLCYWVWLRSKFQRKVFYNATSVRMGSILGLAQSTANQHISYMVSEGWLVRSGKHLMMPKLNCFNAASLVTLPVSPDKVAQIEILRNVYINNNLFSQDRAIEKKKKAVLHASTSLKKLRYIKRDTSFEEGTLQILETSLTDRPTLSNYKIGLLFGLSKRSGSRIQVRMNRMGLLKSESFYEHINVDISNLPSNAFLWKNRCYMRRRANSLYPAIDFSGNKKVGS